MRVPDTGEMRDTDECADVAVPADQLDALRTPLAVILGRAQLLERRMLRGCPVSPDEYLSSLALIARAAWQIEMQLRVLQDQAYRLPDET